MDIREIEIENILFKSNLLASANFTNDLLLNPELKIKRFIMIPELNLCYCYIDSIFLLILFYSIYILHDTDDFSNECDYCGLEQKFKFVIIFLYKF